VAMHEMQGFKPGTPNYRGRDPVACGGLKPFSVRTETTEKHTGRMEYSPLAR
jgi:hypothetical protein